jgi:hypothetical protein
MIERDDARESELEHVREALGEAGERDQGHSPARVDPRRDREARDRLGEDPPADRAAADQADEEEEPEDSGGREAMG